MIYHDKLVFLIVVFSTAVKLMFHNAYRSTDFEVHRNWLAITSSLPISKWYYEDRSQWTLDYPPFFAWFEFSLSQVAFYFDWKMLLVDNLEYASNRTILFQRLSVICADMLLIYSIFKYCKTQSLNNTNKDLLVDSTKRFIICAVVFNVGLLLVDHIHFQYNGFLFGLLILSIAAMNENKYLQSAFWFMTLLNFKHIFLYIAPVYIIYLLRKYCFPPLNSPLKGISSVFGVNIFDIIVSNLFKLAFVVICIFTISIGPFLYMGDINQLLSRLFPVKRGLCHAYWAANFWACYNMLDKVVFAAGIKMGFAGNFTRHAASMTGGLVAQQNFHILPNISPLTTAVITILTMMPILLKIWYRPNVRNMFLSGLVLCSYSSFLFGYHVHEKAIMLIVLPLTLLVPRSVTFARVFILVQTVGHYALFPLLYKSAETPIKLSLFLLFTIISIYYMKQLPSLKLHSSCLGIPFVKWYEALYLYALLPLYIFTDVICPYTRIAHAFPFLPLLATSLYCSIGILWSWLVLLHHCITS